MQINHAVGNELNTEIEPTYFFKSNQRTLLTKFKEYIAAAGLFGAFSRLYRDFRKVERVPTPPF